MHGFSSAWGSAPLTPALFKGQLYISEHEGSDEGKESLNL